MEKTISERAAIYQFGKTDIKSDAAVYERGDVQGAEEQHKIDIEEACDWLRENLTRYAAIKQPMNKIIEDFEKAMEQ